MTNPDLQKSGGVNFSLDSIPYWAKWVIGGTSILGLTMGGIYLASSDDDSDERRVKIESTGVPADFLMMEEPKKEPDDIPEPLKEVKKPKPVIVYKERHRKRLSAKDAFISKKVNKQSEQDRLRAAINAKRRGSSITRVASVDSSYKNAKNLNIDKNWRRYGIEEDTASYPVKLDRTITVDRMIPALLINEIISDIGGKVTAQIEENIYGAHGRKVLIPAGSKAIGRYQPLKKVGDERLRLLWERIITPNGINILTNNAELADGMGRSGGTGDVDRRYTERYGMAFLFSTITSAAAYQIPTDNTNQQLIISNYTKDLGNATNQILEEHINIKPRMTIPAGSRIFINPVRDIWFPKSRNKVIQASFLNEDK